MKKLTKAVVGVLALATLPAWAATQDIQVAPAGDVVYYRYWGGGFVDKGSIVDANPNQVSHDYAWGSGAAFESSLTFDLSGLQGLRPADIQSVTLNFNIESVWTQGRDDVANIGAVGTVLASGGTGWKSFDVTSSVVQALDAQAGTVGYYFSYTGYSGMTFSSAEGGQPAFLRLTTTAPVPEPETYALGVAGLAVVGALARRRRP
jgi:MYXO-CTERM domain-containing protein